MSHVFDLPLFSLQFTQQQWRGEGVKSGVACEKAAASEFLRNGEWAYNGK